MPLKQYDYNNNYVDTIYTKKEFREAIAEAVKREKEWFLKEVNNYIDSDNYSFTQLEQAIKARGE